MSPRSPPPLPELLAHTRWIEDLARSLVRDPTTAEDLAQSTYLIALERTDTTPPTNLRAWLTRVLRNKARETNRRESNRNSIERLGARTEALPSTEEVIERAEHERRVVTTVLALEDPHRSTLLLRYFEGLSPDDIARRSHVPLATVTSRITRAHARLRESLSKDGKPADWIAAIAPILERSSSTHALTATSLTGIIVMSTALKVLAALALVALIVWWALPSGSSSATTAALEPSTHETSPADAHAHAPDEPLAVGSKRTPSTAPAPDKAATDPIPPAATAPTPAPPSAETGGGRIYGRVFRPDGEPAAQRKVRWMRMGDNKDKFIPTDDTGAFDERNLAPGTWSLGTWPDEKELALLGKTPAETMNGMAYIAQASVEITRGMEKEVVLGKPPENGVRVHGHLLLEGKPVDGFMQWMPESPEAMDLQKIASAKADKGYDLLLDNPGRYLIIASSDDARAEFVIDVPQATEFEHDVSLPDGMLTGRVTTREGEPVKGARVGLVPRGGTAPRNPVADAAYSHRTDADGKFQFHGLPRARFVLGVSGGASGPKDSARPATAAVVRDIDLVSTGRREDILVSVTSGTKVKGTVTTAAGGTTKNTQVFVFAADGEPVNPLDAIGPRDGKFETFALEPGTWFAVAAGGLEWSPTVRFDIPVQGEVPDLELKIAPVAKLTVDIGGMEPTWIDVRDANHCCLSSLLDKHVFSREVSREWNASTFLYRLPAGNFDVTAIGAKDRRTVHVSLVQGQELVTHLGAK